MNTDVMFDLETLATSPNAAILSIGACAFNIELGLPPEPHTHFQRVVDIDSNIRSRRRIDGRTIQWWMDQEEAAQNSVFRAEYTVQLDDALSDFAIYLARFDYQRLWCRGAAFDIPILETAYEAMGRKAPWPHYALRCQRTLEDLAGVERPERQGVHHNALEDAVYQAQCAIVQYQAIKAATATELKVAV